MGTRSSVREQFNQMSIREGLSIFANIFREKINESELIDNEKAQINSQLDQQIARISEHFENPNNPYNILERSSNNLINYFLQNPKQATAQSLTMASLSYINTNTFVLNTNESNNELSNQVLIYLINKALIIGTTIMSCVFAKDIKDFVTNDARHNNSAKQKYRPHVVY